MSNRNYAVSGIALSDLETCNLSSIKDVDVRRIDKDKIEQELDAAEYNIEFALDHRNAVKQLLQRKELQLKQRAKLAELITTRVM